MRIVLAEIETTEKRAGHRYRKFVGDNPSIGVKHQVEHIDFLLIKLGIDKLIISRPDIGRHIRLSAKLPVGLEERLEAGMGVRDLKGMLLLTVGADVGIAQRPFHTVVPNCRVTNHCYLRNVLAYLEIVFQLDGLRGIVGASTDNRAPAGGNPNNFLPIPPYSAPDQPPLLSR